jgi:hypothetical protein
MTTLRFVRTFCGLFPAAFLAVGAFFIQARAVRAAAPEKVWPLAALADLAYVDNKVDLIGIKNEGESKKLPFDKFTFNGAEYLPLYRLNEKKTKVQALALYRDDGTLILSYAGTKDPFDVLADLGIDKQEREYKRQKAVYDTIDAGKKVGIYSEKEAKLLRRTQLKKAYSPAKRRGKPQGCPKGTFFDLRKGGECWSCPKGWNRTIFPVDGDKACVKPARNLKRKGRKKKKGKGVLGTACPKGQFFNLKNKTCYKCDKGWRHNPLFPATKSGVCYKTVKARHGKATRHNHFLCPEGQFYDIGLATCWSCPKGFNRTAENVQSAHACLKRYTSDKREYTRTGKAARLDDQMMVARRFADRFLDKKGKVLPAVVAELGGKKIARTIVIGHSLGGYIAQVIAAERGTKGVTFNAPGAHSYEPKLKGAGVRNFTRAHDVVGQYGTHIGKKRNVHDLPIKNDELWVKENHSITRLAESLKAEKH